MNERIDKLLVKAGAYFGGEGVDYSNFDPKKFAELLIREYSYDVMDLNGAKPERVQYAAKCWGVEV